VDIVAENVMACDPAGEIFQGGALTNSLATLATLASLASLATLAPLAPLATLATLATLAPLAPLAPLASLKPLVAFFLRSLLQSNMCAWFFGKPKRGGAEIAGDFLARTRR